MPPQSVYFFGDGSAEGTKEMKAILGGKGANLAEMTNLGVPVPPGFTVACALCIAYLRDRQAPESLKPELDAALRRLEHVAGKAFGDSSNPLLVSVRSGSPVSMPGMMETILNLGLNDDTVEGLARASGNPRFAYDSYRRFIQMYGDVVLGVPTASFEQLLSNKRMTAGVATDAELDEATLRALVGEYKALVRAHTKADFPMDPTTQLWGAIEAVWRSWTLKKAVDYRRVNGIPEDLGTAVNIVSMVFGNLGDDSGTGVAFTRNPSTGEKKFYGEFLINAQGEDVVSGSRTPLSIDEMGRFLPGAYEELLATERRLEAHFRDMQDIEFTVERGRLYLLQTRTGKRTAAAAVRVATDMVDEGLITCETAVQRVAPDQLAHLLHPVIEADVRAAPLCTGLPASHGAASGVAVFDPDVAERLLVEIRIELRAVRFLDRVELVLEGVLGNLEHDAAEHLDEPAIAVECKPAVVGTALQALDRGVVQPEVEDRVHHARHRELRARSHGHKQGVVGRSERRAGRFLELLDVLVDLPIDRGGDLLLLLVIDVADLGRDREARRHRQARIGHLGEPRSFAPEQVLHVPVAVGFAAPEEVHVFL